MKWFNQLDTKWRILIIIGIIILLIILWKKYGYLLQNLFVKKTINPSTVTLQNGQTVTLNSIADLPQTQKTYLEDLASKIFTDIQGLNVGGYHNVDLYKEAAGLSDVEIDYLAQYYKRDLASGVPLYKDISGESFSWFQDNTGVTTLLTKLKATGNIA